MPVGHAFKEDVLATIVGAAWVVGKIYRVGILMHGSKPKFKDLMRWIKEA